MASNEIKVGVNVSDNGTAAKTEKQVDKLHKKLEQAQKTAEKVNVGGTAGSRAASQKSEKMENTGYRAARGSMGATGAGARDFAREAQGLGGLVRLYATYAANIFAVTAAFGALSRAMDTTNMIRGLDALGAASGKNLGQLSKRLVDATDGAISLQEAMKAVAQTSSAGMSSQNIERLAKVAKNASLALGVSMPDAMSRLSRGVTKLEPELLDELGIMTKLDPAVKAYSRELGKSASQLTDYERRQAFANAVLAEGEKKFSALADAAANPYDKLLASLKDVTQTGLEVINKFVTPFIELLANSPTALVIGIGLVAKMLLQQAMPAIGQFREGLKSAADEATKMYEGRAKAAEYAHNKVQELQKLELGSIADAHAESVALAEQDLGFVKRKSALFKIMKKDLHDMTEEDLKRIERSARSSKDSDQAAKIREYGAAIKGSMQAEAEYAKEKRASAAYTKTQEVAERARQVAIRKGIVSNAAYNASLIGMQGAITILNAEMEANGIIVTSLQGRYLRFKATMAGIAGVASTVGSAINKALGIIGIIFTVVQGLDSLFSKADKEATKFSSALDNAESSAEAAARTFKFLSEQPVISERSTKDIATMSSSLAEVNESIKGVVSSSKDLKGAMGVWDKFKNYVYGFFDADVDSNVAKSLAGGIVSAMKLVKGSGIEKSARASFAQLTKVDPTNIQATTEAIKEMGDATKDALVARLNELNTTIGDSNIRLQNFENSLTSVTTKYQDYLKSTANTDPLFTLGSAMQELQLSMQKLNADGLNEIGSAFESLANNSLAVSAIGGNFIDQFVKGKAVFEQNTKAVKDYQYQLDSTNAAIDSYNKIISDAAVRFDGDAAAAITTDTMAAAADEAVAILSRESVKIEKNLISAQQEAAKTASALFKQGMDAALIAGDSFVKTALKNAKEQAQAIIDQAKLGGLSGENLAVEQNRIAQEQIKTELNQIKVNIDLILANERLTAAINLNTARADLRDAKKEGKVTTKQQDAVLVAEGVSRVLNSTEAQKSGVINFKDAGVDAKSEVGMQVRANIQGALTATAAQQAQVDIVKGKEEAQALKYQRDLNNGILQDKKEILKYSQEQFRAENTLANIRYSILGTTSEELIKEQQIRDQRELAVKQGIQLLEIDTKIANAANDKERAKLKEQKSLLLIQQANERTAATAKTNNELLAKRLSDLQYEASISQAHATLQQEYYVQSLSYLQQEQQLKSSLYGYSEMFNASESNRLETLSAQQQANSQLLAQEAELAVKKAERDAKVAQLDPTKDKSAIDALNEQYTREESLAKLKAKSINQELEAKLKVLELQKQISLEQARYNELSQLGSDIQSGFGNALGDFGKTLGDMVKGMVDMSVASLKTGKAMDEMQAKIKKFGKNSKEGKEAQIEYDRLRNKGVKDEISGYANVAGAAKKMFGEKTAAAKAFGAFEKAMHIARLAMDITEVVSKLTAETAKTGIENAGFMSRLPTYISEIYAKTAGQLGIFGPIAAAGLIALIGMGGSRGSSTTFVPNAEQQQGVQGTAYGYDDQGNKVQVRRGVFGAEDQKSQTIVNSLEIMKNNSVEGLAYDNKMLRALEGLKVAITSAATSIYSVAGLRGIGGQSLSGIQEGTNTSGGLLGIGGLFSSSTTKSIADSGIIIKDSFADLASGITEGIKGYEVVTTTRKSSGFLGIGGSTKTYTNTYQKTLEQMGESAVKAGEQIAGVFAYGATYLEALGDKAKISGDVVQAALGNINVDLKTSLKGLSGQALTDELTAVFSQALDDAAAVIFADFEQFAQFGEGFAETVLRVVDSAQKVEQSLSNMGISMDKFAGLGVSGEFQVTETLIDLAGGVDKFVDSANNYYDKFLTNEEKLAIKSKAVTEEMTRLGYGTVTTIDQFKALLKTIDVVNSPEVYTALMNVSAGFYDVASAADEAAQAIADEAATLQDKLNELLLTNADLRALELLKLDESNRGLQEEIWRIEDLNAAHKKLADEMKTAADEVTNAASAVASAQAKVTAIEDKAIKEYETASNAVVTAQQKVIDLQVQAAKAMGTYSATLKSFIEEQVNLTSQGTVSLASALSSFNLITAKAMSGDTTSIQGVQSSAQAALDAAKRNARSQAEFNVLKANILSEVAGVANYAQAQASSVSIPEDDPMVLAQKALLDAQAEATKALETLKSITDRTAINTDSLEQQYLDAKEALRIAKDEELAAIAHRARVEELLGSIDTSLSTSDKRTEKFISAADSNTVAITNTVSDNFSTLDTSVNDLLDFDELKRGLRNVATDSEIQNYISSLDTNLDGYLDRGEVQFGADLVDRIKDLTKNLDTNFNLVDLNLDTLLTKDEVATALTGLATNTELAAVIGLLDTNLDGYISAAELATNNLNTDLKTALGDTETGLGGVINGTTGSVDSTNTAVTAAVDSVAAVHSTTLTVLGTKLDALGKAIVYNTNSTGSNLTGINNTLLTTNAYLSSINTNTVSLGSALGTKLADLSAALAAAQAARTTYTWSYDGGYDSYGFDGGVSADAGPSVGDGGDGAGGVDGTGGMGYATGAAFIKGKAFRPKYFADGGVLSNKVVSSPVAFNTGVMGEAGPEAVMPLGKTKAGKLGVIATAPKPSIDSPVSTNTTDTDKALVAEIRALKEEVSMLRYEARATAASSNKTSKILERVTRSGESLLVTDTATL